MRTMPWGAPLRAWTQGWKKQGFLGFFGFFYKFAQKREFLGFFQFQEYF
jgi:hypothetical protein